MAAGTLAGTTLAGSAASRAKDRTGAEPPVGDDAAASEPIVEDDGEDEPFEERFPGLRVLERDPENAEAADRATYAKSITPRSEHYVRNHYPTPEIDADEWTIDLRGLGVDPVELSMDELRAEFETESVAHTMQCSGNGRAFLEPEIDGVSWTIGAVGTTVWTGTPLSAILERYGAETGDGTWLMVAGGDHPEGEDIFARSIPMAKVLEDCVLAYEMNGEPLSPEHGYPVRLVVPGWYGNNCVKWVAELEVLEKMHVGDEWDRYAEWQHESYRLLADGQEAEERERIADFGGDAYDTREQMDAEAAGEIDHAPYVYDQLVQSLIGYPGEDAALCVRPQDGRIEVVGVAWAGDDAVERVDVSIDGGDTWNDAEFFGSNLEPYGWRQFRYLWDADPGEYTLVSRATDEHGRTQPREVARADEGLLTIENDRFPWNRDGYCNNAYLPRGVDVTVEERSAE